MNLVSLCVRDRFFFVSGPPSWNQDSGSWAVINPASKTENQQPRPLPLGDTETAGRSKAYYSGTHGHWSSSPLRPDLGQRVAMETAVSCCVPLSHVLSVSARHRTWKLILCLLKVLFSQPSRGDAACGFRGWYVSHVYSLFLSHHDIDFSHCNRFSSTCNSDLC